MRSFLTLKQVVSGGICLRWRVNYVTNYLGVLTFDRRAKCRALLGLLDGYKEEKGPRQPRYSQ
jgi:hypothetical protein